MKSLLKGLFGFLALALMLIIAVIAGITLLLDPNDYKQELSTLAAKQGVTLKIEGNVAWQFFPDLGLSVNKLSLHVPQQTNKALAQIETLTASVQFMPLLKKQVRINGIHLTKPHINLSVNEQGQGNWLLLPQGEVRTSQQLVSETQEEPSASALELETRTFSISEATLNYSDAKNKQQFSLSDINLSGQNINLSEQAFPLDLQMSLVTSGTSNPIALQWQSKLTLNNTLSKISLLSGLLKLESSEASLELKLSANAEYNGKWLYAANYELSPLNIKLWLDTLGLEVPQTHNNRALTKVSLTGKASTTPDATHLNDLELVLDNTTFKGDIALSHKQHAAHTIQLSGDNFIADDYLATETNKKPSSAGGAKGIPSGATDSNAQQAETLPIETLRALNFNADISLQTLQAMGLEFSSLKLVASGNSGVLNIENFHSDFYQGDIDAQAHINASGEVLRVKSETTMKAIQIKELMSALAPEDSTSTEHSIFGLINAQLKSSSEGSTTNKLSENLSANISFNTENLQLRPLNLEEEFCQALESLSPEKTSLPAEEENHTALEPTPTKQWPALTELRNVNGVMNFSQQRLTINNISAGVENLLIGTRGFADLNQNHYSLQLPMTLKNEFSSDNGCRIKSNFIRNRELSLIKCEGSIEPFNTAKACGLDKREFRNTLKDLAKYQAKKKLGTKKDRLLEKANEKFGKGAADLLKDLFKR